MYEVMYYFILISKIFTLTVSNLMTNKIKFKLGLRCSKKTLENIIFFLNNNLVSSLNN